MQPTTREVLEIASKYGVVVGSFPRKQMAAKDIDIVLRPRTEDERSHPVFNTLLERFRDYCESEITGHLFVYATPMNVELIEDLLWRTGDPDKDSNMQSYRTARRGALKAEFFGITLLVSAKFAVAKPGGWK